MDSIADEFDRIASRPDQTRELFRRSLFFSIRPDARLQRVNDKTYRFMDDADELLFSLWLA